MPEWATESVPGLVSWTNHWSPPVLVMAWYPPTVGLPASPDPTNTESVPPGEMGATDGEDWIGAPSL